MVGYVAGLYAWAVRGDPGPGRRGAGDGEHLGEVCDGVGASVVHAAEFGMLSRGQFGLFAAEVALGLGDGHALAVLMRSRSISNSANTASLLKNHLHPETAAGPEANQTTIPGFRTFRVARAPRPGARSAGSSQDRRPRVYPMPELRRPEYRPRTTSSGVPRSWPDSGYARRVG